MGGAMRIGTAAGLLLLATASPARADLTRTWTELCGGTSFRTCVSVQLTVLEDARLLVRVRNLAGTLGSYSNAVLAFLGFGDLPPRAGPYEYAPVSTTGPGIPPEPGVDPDPWVNTLDTFEDRVQLEPLFGFGSPDGGIVGSCIDLDAAPVPLGGYWATPVGACSQPAIVDASLNGGWVEMLFEDLSAGTAAWTEGSLDHVELTVFALDGAAPFDPDRGSLLTTSQAVPEPLSMLLLGTGLLGVGGVRRLRRRE